MVLICVYPRCLNRRKRKQLRMLAQTHPGVVSFHAFPFSDPSLLKVCSDHFSPDDPGVDRIVLTSSAVPTVCSTINTCCGAETCTGQENTSHKHLLLLLTSPQPSEKHTYPSTSGTYYDEPAAVDSEPDDLNISMLSLDPPSEKKDVSFVPHSSSSASSTTTTTDEEEEQTCQERKWIVNESALMQQFRRCQDCGALISGKNITSVGSRISVIWQCEQGHKGHWKSCSHMQTSLNGLRLPKHSSRV
uniref:THAP-type domain-containing protein n=1 Tax=Cyprinus carpio TaxID=7962 RepID=A0A8C1ZPN4_CYPCA